MKRKLAKLLKELYGAENYNAGHLYKSWDGWWFTPFGATNVFLGETLQYSIEVVEQRIEYNEEVKEELSR